MSNDATITVTGHVGSEPRYFGGENGAPNYASFRMASTRSYFNRVKNTWVESETTWFTVKAWRALATNINDSISKGDAVIVSGVLGTQKWNTQEGVVREALVIDASAVGPNLARGTAKFRPSRAQQSEPAAQNGASQASTTGAGESLDRTASSNGFSSQPGPDYSQFRRVPGEVEDSPATSLMELAQTMVETSDGVYEQVNDESATNAQKDESKVPQTA